MQSRAAHFLAPLRESDRWFVYLALRNIRKRWTLPIRDSKAALNRFTIQFEGRLTQLYPESRLHKNLHTLRPVIAEKRYQKSDQHYHCACKLDEVNGTMGRSHQCEMVDGQRRQQLPGDDQSDERGHTDAGHQDDVAEQRKRPITPSNTHAGCAGIPASRPKVLPRTRPTIGSALPRFHARKA